MKGLRSIRPLGPDSLRGLEPGPIGKPVPKLEWVDPRTLYVEEGYQRDIGEAGTALIRKIYAAFSWARFKPPICVRLPESGNVLVCIDGQHTATAAATHPLIDKIPVMIVSAADAAQRASAFVGHNRERVALTPQAVYRAELAAGDPQAVAVDRACRAAGANVLAKPVNLKNKQPVGSTVAIGTMKAVAKRQGEEALVRVLRLLVAAGRGPIKADEIGAAALIFASGTAEAPGFDERLRAVVASKNTEAWAAIGAAASAESREPLASAVAAAWCSVLGVRLARPTAKASSRGGAATRFVERALRKPAPPPDPMPAAVLTPVAAPAAPATALPKPPAPSVRPSPVLGMIRHNGIKIDLQTREVTRGDRRVRIHRDDGVRLIVALARVMPALLDSTRLVKKTFIEAPSVDGTARLRALIDDINPILRALKLEVKTVPKIGHSLFDLGGG